MNNRKPATIELIVTPLLIDEIITNSALRFLNNQSLFNRTARPAIIRLLRNFRITFMERLQTKLKRKLSSVYLNASASSSGMVLIPLLNLANRLLTPDLPNMSAQYKAKERAVLPLTPHWLDQTEDWTVKYMKEVKKGNDKLTTLIEAFDLQNIASVRKLLMQDVNSAPFLQIAFRLFQDTNLAGRFAIALQEHSDSVRYDYQSLPDIVVFLEELLQFYKPHDVVSLMEKAESYRVRDCQRIYGQLSETNKAKLKASHVRLRDLHDWMTTEHSNQIHPNVPLNIPEYIIRRLSMQTDRMSFFLPQQSLDLLKAGHVLHNCVASYSEAVKLGKSWIVLVADKQGKYMACLRVEQNRLVEAKINGNDPVSDKKEINQAVFQWAEKLNITIDTQDVSLEVPANDIAS